MNAKQIAEQIAKLTAELESAERTEDRRDRKIGNAVDMACLLREGSVTDQAVASYVYDAKVAFLKTGGKPTKTPRTSVKGPSAKAIREHAKRLEHGEWTVQDVLLDMGYELPSKHPCRATVREVMAEIHDVIQVGDGRTRTPYIYSVA